MDRKEVLRSSDTSGLPFAISKLSGSHLSTGTHLSRSKFTPVTWDKYFDSRRTVTVGQDMFNVFEKGTDGPVLLLLHGGGFSGLSWALFAKAMTERIVCRCLAIDLRGHGDTVTTNDDDLSVETLSSDVGNVLREMYSETCPLVILVGHSLGGAVSIHVASRALIPTLSGLVVIDVVEGTALESLSSMESLVRGRPVGFRSLENAIEWSFRSGHIKNPESACVSMIGQLKQLTTSGLPITPAGTRQSFGTTGTIDEDPHDEDSVHNIEGSVSGNQMAYTWRIDLVKTQPFWFGWFKGLSQMFLSCAVPKLLLLAGMDRLDKDLMIGQMQGKFQMVVLPKSGHAVQEDQPVKVADALATFMLRNKIVEQAVNFTPTFPSC